jgi:hypothetical protein
MQVVFSKQNQDENDENIIIVNKSVRLKSIMIKEFPSAREFSLRYRHRWARLFSPFSPFANG